MNQLTVNQLSFTVPGEQGAIHLLEEVSLGLCAGECIGILGPNGAGKSTLVKLLAGLLPAARGSVALNNQPIGEMSLAQRAMSIAYLAQQSYQRYCHCLLIDAPGVLTAPRRAQ